MCLGQDSRDDKTILCDEEVESQFVVRQAECRSHAEEVFDVAECLSHLISQLHCVRCIFFIVALCRNAS